jgi:hypothetical protein
VRLNVTVEAGDGEDVALGYSKTTFILPDPEAESFSVHLLDVYSALAASLEEAAASIRQQAERLGVHLGSS